MKMQREWHSKCLANNVRNKFFPMGVGGQEGVSGGTVSLGSLLLNHPVITLGSGARVEMWVQGSFCKEDTLKPPYTCCL